MFGTITHLCFDAVLLSAFLAGIRRTTGLTPKLSDVPNKDIRQLLRSYLEFGEYVFDFAVVVFGRSSSFERRRD
ncbi:DUF1748-domain-containing protein [Daedalea quercina L-15889]|uniref:DUF1748-domain-containing protein n=1 Tax=Daedalea quercina L-15889 TaxID=1314783 RepID=A0A165U7U5_9APHY|nr:DUF1748-domain-containing protein [Daedalea quercina L-15889]